jgi:multidrug transporter EmrE-like cation transporter
MENKFWIILCSMILLETIAMTITENSVKLHNYHYILAVLLYGLVSYLFYNLLVYSKKSGCTVNAIWNCSTTVILALISVFYFKKNLNLNEKVGIFLAVLSILFMESIIKLN